MSEISLRAEIDRERRLLEGNINRMICTDSVEELEHCAYFAYQRITELDDLKHRLLSLERIMGREER